MSVPADKAPAVIVDHLRLELVVESADLAASLALSAAEAAWRGDVLELGIHLRRLRDCVRVAIQTFNEMHANKEAPP